MVLDFFKMLLDFLNKNRGAIVVIFSGIVALFSIIRIYYIRKLSQSPTKSDARKKHTADLVEFLKKWYDEFPEYEKATKPKTALTSSTFNYKFQEITKNWRYQDLIQYHLPNEYKILPVKWEEYKQVINKYEKLRFQLYVQIKKDILGLTRLKINSIGSENHAVSDSFVKLIYMQTIFWIKEGRLYNDKNSLHYKRKGNELRLKTTHELVILAKGTAEERDRAKEVFENMMFERDYLEKYKTNIIRIINKEENLEKLYDEIIEILDKLISYPLLPEKKCPKLKNI